MELRRRVFFFASVEDLPNARGCDAEIVGNVQALLVGCPVGAVGCGVLEASSSLRMQFCP